MQENFLHLLSETPCKVSINGNFIGIIDNHSTMEIDIITKTEKVYIEYTPISNESNFIPYCVELCTISEPQTNNEYIKVIPFPNNHYDIIMKPFYYYQIDNMEVLLNQQIGKYYLSITNDTMTRITLYSGASIVYSTQIQKIISAKASIEKDILTIEGIVDNETYYLLIINTSNFEVLYNDISHSIENSSNQILALKNLYDICHHSQVFTFNKEDKTTDNYHVYQDNDCKDPHSLLLIPKVFLECIKVNDESYAKTLLSQELINTPLTKFKSYFGDTKAIYLNRHNIVQDKLNYTILANTYKNYSFIMQNNKIKDIEEIF